MKVLSTLPIVSVTSWKGYTLEFPLTVQEPFLSLNILRISKQSRTMMEPCYFFVVMFWHSVGGLLGQETTFSFAKLFKVDELWRQFRRIISNDHFAYVTRTPNFLPTPVIQHCPQLFQFCQFCLVCKWTDLCNTHGACDNYVDRYDTNPYVGLSLHICRTLYIWCKLSVAHMVECNGAAATYVAFKLSRRLFLQTLQAVCLNRENSVFLEDFRELHANSGVKQAN